jgi:hypothetical protein
LVGGEKQWANELRKQLALEVEIVSSGLAAGDRIDDLRRRLEQVDRLIEAIEGADGRLVDRDNAGKPHS